MKTIAFLAALVLSAPTLAKTPASIPNMFAHCNCVMKAGTCAPYNEVVLSLPPSAYAMPRVLGTLGLVDARTWYAWNGRVDMCEVLVADCTSNWTGDGCRIARSQFRQDSNFECGGGGENVSVAAANQPSTSPTPSNPIVPLTALLFASLAVLGVRRKNFIR